MSEGFDRKNGVVAEKLFNPILDFRHSVWSIMSCGKAGVHWSDTVGSPL